MLAPKRQQEIIKYMQKDGHASVEELSGHFGVVPITIRRDLKKLEEQGLLERSHGGAVLSPVLEKEILYATKMHRNRVEKEWIAKQAKSLVKEDMTLLFDAGTTAYHLMKELGGHFQKLTIITTDLNIAQLAMQHGFTVYLAGGLLQNETGSAIDSCTIEYLQNVKVNLAFLGASSIGRDLRMMTPNPYKAKIKQAMLQSASRSVLLVDGTKFYKDSLFHVAWLCDLDYVITDHGFKIEEQQLLKEKGVAVIGPEV